MESLFATVPEHDHLGLTGHPEKVRKFLGLGEPDLARALHVPPASLRKKTHVLPNDVRERLIEIAIICERVAGYFDGDAKRTTLWFQARNPLLGGLTPRDLIRAGRYEVLRDVVVGALAGQLP